MTEQQIQKKIINYISTIGYCVKVISASKAGVPDLICCINSRFFAFEVKTKTGVVSELQKHNIDLISKSGGKAYIVTSVEDVKRRINDTI